MQLPNRNKILSYLQHEQRWLLAGLLLACIVLGIFIDSARPRCEGASFAGGITKPLLATEVAAGAAELRAIVDACDEGQSRENRNSAERFIAATQIDYGLIAAYGLCFLVLTSILFSHDHQRPAFKYPLAASAVCAVGTAGFDFLENMGMIRVFRAQSEQYSPFDASVKWMLLFGVLLFWALSLLLEPVLGEVLSYLFAFSAIPAAFSGIIGAWTRTGTLEAATSMIGVSSLFLLIGVFRPKPSQPASSGGT